MRDERRAVRAGDADREETIRQLQRGLSQGRLDVAEFDERVRAAYAARTLGELADLIADLPRDLW
ncbi:protein of unknown function [Geodermatophilus obscurus]|uniref:DUF1707 domain-containing protein n=1 Tax=Geodermatophilus obscurus TaxID=1861 RepID=A0A1I5EC37_9ACTN|nr:DUF1707 domain-containing protein [Geodermatophilus obscurus]SFO09047.1 protein of unknown function [Geodermatophilus obscurus]